MNIFCAGREEAGMRLDRWVRRRMVLTGLSHIYRLIRTGGVRINGKKRCHDYRLVENDKIEILSPVEEIRGADTGGRAVTAGIADTDFFKRNFKLLFEDENLMVCDKPPNLVVHSGTGHSKCDSLIDLAAAYCAVSKTSNTRERVEPLLVHRLDRDTSGAILIAKNRRTLRILHEILRRGAMNKVYVALCHGRPDADDGVIEAQLVRHFNARDGTTVRVGAGGRHSTSSYKVIDMRAGIARLEIVLKTGRTHQIRVHMAHLSCPVVGDVRYGDRQGDQRLFCGRNAGLRRLYLHARHISFFYPEMNRTMVFKSPMPEMFDKLWRTLGAQEGLEIMQDSVNQHEKQTVRTRARKSSAGMAVP